MPRKKKEFAVASGEPDKQNSGQQAANAPFTRTHLQEMSKRHDNWSIDFITSRQKQGAIRSLHRSLGIPAPILLQKCST